MLRGGAGTSRSRLTLPSAAHGLPCDAKQVFVIASHRGTAVSLECSRIDPLGAHGVFNGPHDCIGVFGSGEADV